jgi:hypothetical protein
MPATPQTIVEDPGPHWILASFTGGHCGQCKTPIHEGDEIAYLDDTLIRRECCAETGMYLSDTELANANRGRVDRVLVMPRGKTAKDRCPRCFIIHTVGQGDSCD